MDRTAFIDRIAASQGITKKQAKKFVMGILGTIVDMLAAGEEISFSGFGKFYVKQNNARNGRNPSTGERVTFPAKKVPRFKPGKNLKISVN